MISSRTPLLLLASSLLACIPLIAQGGVIYTTDPAGNLVPGNCYSNKLQVHLNGGSPPGTPCNADGLDDGYFYFQVTTLSGDTLLSTDPIADREVCVIGGRIALTTGPHLEADGVCGSKIIELAPFNDSPDTEYLVWLTSVTQYDRFRGGFFGFQLAKSRTSSFKVLRGMPTPQSIIEGTVFYDIDESGVFDPLVTGEVPIAGWRVEISVGGALEGFTFTDCDGKYQFIRPQDSTTYEIEEYAPAGGYAPLAGATWFATNATMGTAITDLPAVAGPDFGNLQLAITPGVGLSKGFWHNQGESLLANCDETWRIAVNGPPGDPVCLRTNVSSADPAVSIFTVPLLPVDFTTAFGLMSSYLVSPAQGHAGYILGCQVAATILNNTCGMMQGTVYIDRFGTGELISLESMLTDASILLCAPGAGQTKPQDPFFPSPFDPTQSLRDAILACANEFTAINSTSNTSEPQITYQPKSSPEMFDSPYEKFE